MELMTRVQTIYVSPEAGSKMNSASKVKILPQKGIEGDRYTLNKGAYSLAKPIKIRDITFISRVGIDDANHYLKSIGQEGFTDSETRRNIVLNEITSNELNNLIGKVFSVGDVSFRGTELCTPCERPSKLANKKCFLKAFLIKLIFKINFQNFVDIISIFFGFNCNFYWFFIKKPYFLPF